MTIQIARDRFADPLDIALFANEEGLPEIVTSVIRLAASAEYEVDNVRVGGLIAAVDAASGVLGVARRGNGIGEYRFIRSAVRPSRGGACRTGWRE